MKYLNLIVVLFLFSCTKEVPTTTKPLVNIPVIPPLKVNVVYSVESLDSITNINKNSSWYQTNKSFDELLNITKTPFNGLNQISGTFSPYVFNSTTVADYWNDRGMYFYYDFNKDGKKDVWTYNFKSPWPTNQRGVSAVSYTHLTLPTNREV